MMSSERESGFSLIELILVLALLGILMSFALVKYFDLQSEARNKALQAALAEGASRIHGYYAKQVFMGSEPSVIDYNDESLGTNAGDFVLSFSGGDSSSGNTIITITTTMQISGSSSSRTVRRPE